MSPTPTTVGPWEQFGRNPSITATVASAADPPDFLERLEREQALEIARERFRVARDGESRRREEMLTDMRFSCGHQWDEDIQRQRDAQGRPCLTINRIPGFLKHVLNSLRQNRPEIKVVPVGSGSDTEMAEIKQGLIRHIVLNSRGDLALDTAFENMCTMGLGYLRVIDDWADVRSFDKDLRVEWIPNTFSVYFDPGANKPDWSDAKYAFIVEDISIAEFKQRFGDKSNFVSLSEFSSIGDHQPVWMPGGKIRIAEYFHVEEVTDTLYGFSDGSTRLLGDLNLPRGVTLVETTLQSVADPNGTGQEIQESVVTLSDGSLALTSDFGLAPDALLTQQAPRKVPRIIWTLMSGIEVLKERVWPGKYIPIIPMIGNQREVDGERILTGMVRFSREAQRMFNYMYSCFVEAVALVPKAPWVAEFDQINEFRATWDNAHKTLQAVLPYRAKSTDAGLVPPPQRQQAEPPIAAFVEGLKLSDQNLKSTFSIYEASLGEKGPQESGRAINARKIESETATYDWIDNFNRTLIYLGMILEDLLPHYYNTPGRIVQIMREDRQIQEIVFNKEHQAKDGQTKKFDLAQGRYGVQLSTGPSYMTRRQESAASMMELAKFYPQLMQIAGPQVVRAMDWPENEAIAAQLEKAQPPELREPKEGEQPDPQELQAQLAKAVGMVQQLTQALQASSNEASIQREKEMWATLRTQMQEENKAAIAQLQAGSREAQFLNEKLFAEMERLRAILEGQLVPAAEGEGSPARGSAPTAARSSGAPAAPPPAQVSAPQMPPGGGDTAAP